MKSRLIEGPKFETLQFRPEHLTLTVERAEIEQFVAEEFARVAKQHGELVQLGEADALVEGDIVEVSLRSAIEKFNQTIPLALGRGFFDQDIEVAMVGMTVGQEKTLSVQGEAVTLVIESAKRKVIPAVTAAMLAEEFGEFYPDAETVKDFEVSFFEERLEDYKYNHYFDEVAGYMSDELLKTIKIESDEAEYQAFRDEIWESLKLEAQEMESEFEAYLYTVFSHDDDQVADIYPVVEAAIQRDYIFYVYAYHTLKDEVTPPTEADYEVELEAWSAESDKPLEDLRLMMPYSGAIKRTYIEAAQQRMMDKFYQELVVTLV